ncbi:hypothetical protein [Nocardiopsis sp. NRRL B-16309]|uniref:hypothetical protein n=1 Tax=Nocardiopsis sp. NRRL B-16309 TaxID=1519494 RepID=UPI0006AF4DC9|nr:hypothetical protein [Nocardiopsis sp. NRRL B-16309]
MLMITLGTVLTAAAARRPRLRPLAGSLLPLAAGLVLVLLFEFGLRAATLHQPTEHTVADAFPDTPAPVPSEIGEVGWEWEAPHGVSLRSVEPGPLGPLLVLEDGVVALDGSSGEVLWSYRHPYNGRARVVVSDGGTRATVTRRPAADRSHSDHVTEIDTETGEVIREVIAPPLDEEDEDIRIDFLGGTSEVGLYFWQEVDEGPRIHVHAVDSNEELWSPTVPEPRGRTCSNIGGWRNGEDLLLYEDQVLITYVCADLDRLVGETTLGGRAARSRRRAGRGAGARPRPSPLEACVEFGGLAGQAFGGLPRPLAVRLLAARESGARDQALRLGPQPFGDQVPGTGQFGLAPRSHLGHVLG